jgi:hypothetical protein
LLATRSEAEKFRFSTWLLTPWRHRRSRLRPERPRDEGGDDGAHRGGRMPDANPRDDLQRVDGLMPPQRRDRLIDSLGDHDIERRLARGVDSQRLKIMLVVNSATVGVDIVANSHPRRFRQPFTTL